MSLSQALNQFAQNLGRYLELTVETSPAHRSPTTSLTPLNPRSIMLRKNCSQLAASSRMPSSTAMTSRRPSVLTPMATRTLTFSTCPPPGSLVPHAVHEHVRVLGSQRAFPPLVDLLVDLLEFVAQCLGWHPLAPQQPADVVHPACAHAREVHLHQRLLDAGFAPPAALDHRRPEQGALQFGHLETQLAGLGGQRALVVAGAERLPVGLALVSGGVGDLVCLCSM